MVMLIFGKTKFATVSYLLFVLQIKTVLKIRKKGCAVYCTVHTLSYSRWAGAGALVQVCHAIFSYIYE